MWHSSSAGTTAASTSPRSPGRSRRPRPSRLSSGSTTAAMPAPPSPPHSTTCRAEPRGCRRPRSRPRSPWPRRARTSKPCCSRRRRPLLTRDGTYLDRSRRFRQAAGGGTGSSVTAPELAGVETFRIVAFDFDASSNVARFDYAFDDTSQLPRDRRIRWAAARLAGRRRHRAALRLVHLAAGVSYYKAAAPGGSSSRRDRSARRRPASSTTFTTRACGSSRSPTAWRCRSVSRFRPGPGRPSPRPRFKMRRARGSPCRSEAARTRSCWSRP